MSDDINEGKEKGASFGVVLSKAKDFVKSYRLSTLAKGYLLEKWPRMIPGFVPNRVLMMITF